MLLALALAGCADRWLEEPERPPVALRCEQGTVLDLRQGRCVARGCASDDECGDGLRCDRITARCVPDEDGPAPDCEEGESRCSPRGRQLCSSGRWLVVPCPDGAVCSEGACYACTPGERRCGDSAPEVCEDGTRWVPQPCPPSEPLCLPGGICASCLPDDARCVDEGRLAVCTGKGVWQELPCDEDEVCLGAGVCTPRVCAPGESRCDGADPTVEEVCEPDGLAWRAEPCAAGVACHPGAGRCLDACGVAAYDRAGEGCDYWLASVPDAASFATRTQALELVASNPGAAPAEVRVVSVHGDYSDAALLPPGSAARIALPHVAVAGTSVRPIAYHLTSDRPITLHQLSRSSAEDAAGAEVGSAGASLLLPTHLLLPSNGEARYALAGPPHQVAADELPASLVIVATENDTTVRIDAAGWTQADLDGAVRALAPGESAELVLHGYQVLQLATARGGPVAGVRVDGVDRFAHGVGLRGTSVRSDAPVAVYAGSGCSYVPLDAADCDHTEEQLLPEHLWGRRYVAVPAAEGDRFYVVAGAETVLLGFGSDVVLDGRRGRIFDLPAGGTVEVAASAPVEIEGNEPFAVLQLSSGEADLLQLVPTIRYRTRYELLLPRTEVHALELVAPAPADGGAPVEVTVAGQPIGGFQPVPGSDLQVARVELCALPGAPCTADGRYAIAATEPIGVTVRSRLPSASLAYPAGLGTAELFYRPPWY